MAFERPDNRDYDELRPISFETGIARHAAGSVLCCFGETRVICAASVEAKTPPWMSAQGIEGGWISAEYSMLPYSTAERKRRDISRGKQDGRSIEIQRLIGRSLRAAADLSKLPGMSLWIDCDVLQADGGTRTASITGAYVAAQLAVKKLISEGRIDSSPFVDSVAAVSVGVVDGAELLDLCYLEDRDADVDANIVMTGSGQFVEAQASGEEAVFTRGQLDRLLGLAEGGIERLAAFQKEALGG